MAVELLAVQCFNDAEKSVSNMFFVFGVFCYFVIYDKASLVS
jgi:hypothetical protein